MPVKKVKSQKSKVKITTQKSKVAGKKTVILSGAKDLKIKKESRDSSLIVQNDKTGSARKSLSVPVYSLAGSATGTLTLPKEIFGQKVNKKLLAQAIRVYTTNQKTLSGFTKTRGEVEGSTAKIYRQKGTGRARHGSVRAPIFVGGGITFGPKPRKVRLNLPQKMRKAALLSALSARLEDKKIAGLSGIEKASGKTKEMSKLINKIIEKGQKRSALIVTDGKVDNVVRAVRNMSGVRILPANLINAYEVLKHDLLLVTKEAVGKLTKESRVESQESRQKGAETSS